MDSRLQLRVQRYGWDKAEPFYEKGWKESLKPAQELLLNMASLSEGEKVVDISCGTGIVSFQAARLVGPSGMVVGTDISDKMIAASGQKAKSLELENTSFKQMEAEKLALDDETFDVALNALGLMYYPNPEKAIEEMFRVLKPGGRAISAVWGARKNCGWSEIFPIVDERVNTDVCPLFFQLGTMDALASLYQTTGFAKIQSERIHTTLHYASDSDAVNAVFAGGPVAMAYSRFDDKTREEAHQAYLNSISKYKRGEAYHIPGEFVVVSGER